MKPVWARWIGLLIGVVFCGVLLSYGVTQEVPLGRIQGSIVMKENGNPLPGALVSLTRVGSEDDEVPPPKGVETDDKGAFLLRNVPAGAYEITVSADQHRFEPKIVTVSEGKVLRLSLKAKPIDPYLNLYASQKVFTPDETPRVEVHGFVPQHDVKLLVYRLDPELIAKKGGYQQAIYPLAQPSAAQELDRAGTKVIDEKRLVVDRDAEGAFVDTLPIGQRPEGIYLVRCSSGDRSASAVLLVSKLALVTKTGRGQSLCYTTDLRSGRPVGGVAILAKRGEQMLSVGQTDVDGLLTIDRPSLTDNRMVVMARKGESIALVGAYADTSTDSKVWIDSYCDRPAYRPGDVVSFKGFVRIASGDGFALPHGSPVSVEIRDPDGNAIKKLELPMSVHGGFHGEFSTSPESKPGLYEIVSRALGSENRRSYANVVAYRKPEFDITVKPQRDHYTMGDRASAVVECKYYYGGPVVGAKVRASIFRSPAFDYVDEEGETHEGDSYGGGEYDEQVQAVTDASGRAVIEFDTRAKDDPDVYTNDYDYTVTASVTEDGGKFFDGDGKVRVVRGAFDLQLEVQNPVLQKGDTADLLIKTTDPLDATKPAANREVFVDAGREEWTGRTSVFVPRQRYRAMTDSTGVAHLLVSIDRSQSIAFRAMSNDDEGRKIVAQAYAYVVGSPAIADSMKGDLKVTLDKKVYADGDLAKALIQTDMPGGSALVCVQTNEVHWRKLVPLDSGSTLVDIPVRRRFAPNVFVSVSYVRQKHFLQADKWLRVDRQDRTLKVAVTTDRDVYKPGEKAQITVSTTDAAGKPVAAELSLGVVDEGIYAVAEDDTDLYRSLYPTSNNGVSTDYSFPEIYLDGGDKGASKIPLRTNFKDTAAWLPDVVTGPDGRSTVAVDLPDNLTEWRVTARGLSDDSKVGEGRASFRVRKELMLRLQLPQFLVSGDRQRMTVVVANDTGKDQDVRLQIEAGGLALDGDLPKVVRVPSGRPQVVELNATAGQPGQAFLSARGWIDGGPSDGVRQSLPVLPYGRKTLNAQSGEGAADIRMPLGRSLDRNYGSLKITLSPTLAGELAKSLDSLIDYPYGCVEQTMSRFMPSVLVGRTVAKLGLPEPKRMAELPKIVADSLARLTRMQHGDGGWGWWEYDESDPFMTALVLDGLDRARKAGYDVSAVRASKAVEWGMTYLRDRKNAPSTRDKLYLIDALIRWGKTDAAKLLDGVDLKDRTVVRQGRKERSPSSADLASAVLAFKDAGADGRAEEALKRLATRAVDGDQDAYWPAEEGAWGEEPTALALNAYEAVKPNDPIVPKIVRHLMRVRQDDFWSSTRDTSYAIVGLTAYLLSTHEMEGSGTATVLVDGKPVRTVTLDPKVLEDDNRTIVIPRRELGSGSIRVQVRPETTGRCYYTVAFEGLEVGSPLRPTTTDKGLLVDRRYYRMEPQRLENGDLRLLPSKHPITRFQNGDIVRVVITIVSDVPREFVLVEEPTPSSCRVTERTEFDPYDEPDWWWSRTVLMDDHAAFFARSLPKGKSEITYSMRAEQPGIVRALPTTVRNMYDPGRWASSAETPLEVSQ